MLVNTGFTAIICCVRRDESLVIRFKRENGVVTGNWPVSSAPCRPLTSLVRLLILLPMETRHIARDNTAILTPKRRHQISVVLYSIVVPRRQQNCSDSIRYMNSASAGGWLD